MRHCIFGHVYMEETVRKKTPMQFYRFFQMKFCTARNCSAMLTMVNASQKTMNVFIHLPET
jgi:hypothetical protein